EEVARANYGSDSVRQKFTGYERDIEFDLDYANARYYNPMHGRFTSPDPLIASGRAGNPQTWNRYNYAGNNPLVNVDPTGMDWIRSNERDKDG
ncbi:RHS repeat-associated core domain-containing protein, partial [Escherichia coli]|nr:RHS repeat-associated core domain-containing protein [Escherichia coli]